MSTSVPRVNRDTGFEEIARQLAEYDITAVPVFDSERGVGAVSEADPLRKEAAHLNPAGLVPAAPHAKPLPAKRRRRRRPKGC
ncbi:CBS domain-containing protein [Streptomyces sp. NBC_00704]|uniref:CBS domain-containing protein n=1 Tax=Streptomyces sp. NBC_00704 TaxID=2975809 RepID=UPI002E32E394|nr:CBS domain-containing protein [Streptomyces sp. NBC_00704]